MVGIFDVHCHILPEVDDGSRSLEETLEMLRMEYRDGVRTVIFTPHFRREMFETDMRKIAAAFLKTREAAAKTMPDLDLYLGCEYHVNMEMVSVLKNGQRPAMAGSRYVLSEFSGDVPFSYMRERVRELRSNRFHPIIAHTERCFCLRKDISRIEELVDAGAYIQVNAGSILGEEGFGCKQFCKKLMRMDLIHFIGSDSHRTTERVPNIGKCAAYLKKKMGEDYARQLLEYNPRRIIEEGRENR